MSRPHPDHLAEIVARHVPHRSGGCDACDLVEEVSALRSDLSALRAVAEAAGGPCSTAYEAARNVWALYWSALPAGGARGGTDGG